MERVVYSSRDDGSKVEDVISILKGGICADELDALCMDSIKPDLQDRLMNSSGILNRGEKAVYRNHGEVVARREAIEAEKNRRIVQRAEKAEEMRKRKEAAALEREKKAAEQVKKKEEVLKKRAQMAAEKEAARVAKEASKAAAAAAKLQKKLTRTR